MAKPDRRSLLLALGVLVALAVTFLFGYRAGHHARLIRRENEPVRPWMNIRFIAHSHHVSPETLAEAIGVEPRDRRPLRFIARQQHRPVEDLIKQIDTALAQAKAPQPAKP